NCSSETDRFSSSAMARITGSVAAASWARYAAEDDKTRKRQIANFRLMERFTAGLHLQQSAAAGLAGVPTTLLSSVLQSALSGWPGKLLKPGRSPIRLRRTHLNLPAYPLPPRSC